MRENTVLIDRTKLENLFLRYKAASIEGITKAFFFSLSAVATLLLSKATTSEYGSCLGISAETIENIINILLVLSVLCAVILGLRWIHLCRANKIISIDSLQENIIQENQYQEDYTYILLFPKYENNKFYFAVKKKTNWENSYFFPYLKHPYKNDSISGHLADILNEIRNRYHIEIPICMKEVLNDTQSVTKLKDGLPKDFHFKFLYVASSSSFFHTYMREHMRDQGFSWMTIEEMYNDRITCINNHKVLDVIDENISRIKKLYDESKKECTKIIWNIDKRCDKGCGICVYGNTDTIVPEIDELKAFADSILSVDVDYLDLSMGDNANIDNIKKVIEHVKRKSKTSIGLTATAKILNEIGFDFLNKNINEIEVTYDYSHEKKITGNIRPTNYNKDNFELVNNFCQKNPQFKISINIVLHNEINQYELKQLLKNLRKNNLNRFNYLRLMPLGQLSINNYSTDLYNKTFYESLFKTPQNQNPHIHCALRALVDDSFVCEMGTKKLGVSSDGHVYVCAWAEHIRKDEYNPFYIGYLDDYDNLKQLLLDSRRYKDIVEHEKTKDCKIFSCLLGNDIWSKQDKLYL